MKKTIIFLVLTHGGLLPGAHATDAELRGRVIDDDTKASLVDAEVTLTPTGGGAVLTDRTDIFGRYEFAAIPPGDYTLGATHSGYVPFSEARTYAVDEIASETVELVPVTPGGGGGGGGGGPTNRIDVQIQVFDTSTMLALSGVPVRIRRFDLDDPATLEETLTKTTDANGEINLRSQKKGWYDFRFNDSMDGAVRPFYKGQATTAKAKLEKTHTAIAQLLPTGQDVKVTVTGPDPADLGAGPKPLPNVWLELVGIDPAFTPHAGFDPMTDKLSEFAVPIFPKIVGKTNHLGEFTFKDLPPIAFIVIPKKHGYIGPEAHLKPVPLASGDLPATFPVSIDIDPETKLEVVLVTPYTDIKFSEGLAVQIQGVHGTNTEGIERVMPALPIPPMPPELPFGAVSATFDSILPGRYRAVGGGIALSPPSPAGEAAITTIGIRYKGDDYADVATAMRNHLLLDLQPIPATIRGRFFKADDRQAIDLPKMLAPPLDRWEGPAYKLAAQMGIEFKESALADYLPMGMDAVTVDSNPDGTFSLSILPGFYGVLIPPLDGYWGSNFRAKNLATGEEFALGWPYAVDPGAVGGLPVHPFASLGIPISSGDELEIDLFVRKQTYFLDGTVLGDTDSIALDRVLHSLSTPPLLADHNDLAALGTVEYDENDGAPPGPVSMPLKTGFSTAPDGTRTPNINGTFLIEAPPGTHKVTLAHPHHVFPAGIFEVFTLPDYGFVGEGGAGSGIIPMENNWGQLATAFGTVDPFTSDYTGEHTLEIRFWDDGGGGSPVLGRTTTKPDFFFHPDHGSKLFPSTMAPFDMSKGAYTIWAFDGGTWYEDSFTITGASPTNIIVNFNRVGSLPGGHGPLGVPPLQDYDLCIEMINFHDPTHKLADFSVKMTDDAPLSTAPPAGSTKITRMDYTGSYVPKEIVSTPGGAWLPLSGSATSPTFKTELDVLGATAEVKVTLFMKRGSRIMGKVKASRTIGPMTHSVDLDGVDVRIRDRFGRLQRTLATTASGDFMTTTPLEQTETVFAEINEPGFKPYRKRFATANGTDGAGGALDFDLGMIVLEPLADPAFFEETMTFDRRGMFLVGVRKGKNMVGAFGDDPDLDMKMEPKADVPFSQIVMLPDFDSPTGTNPGDVMVHINDRVKRFWIVDPRSFPGSPTDEALKTDFLPPTEVIATGMDAGKPDPLFYRKMRAYVRQLGGTLHPDPMKEVMPKPNVFFRELRASSHAIMGPVGMEFVRTSAMGFASLACLPTDLFEPYIIAETEQGTFKYFRWTREIFDPILPKNLQLFGMRLPPDLNTFADLVGTVSAAESGLGGPTIELQRAYPDGFIRIQPKLSGDITVNDGMPASEPSDMTMRYNYTMDIQFSSGGDLPGTGFLAMGPGFGGLVVAGKYNLDVNGSTTVIDTPGVPAVARTATVDASFTSKEANAYFPTLSSINPPPGAVPPTGPRNLIDFKPTAQIGGSHKRLDLLGFDDMGGSKNIGELMQTKLWGTIGLDISFDVTRALARIPALAPTLTPLRETGTIVATATVKPRVGGKFEHTYCSLDQNELNPPVKKGTFASYASADGKNDSNPLAPRQHAFSGHFQNTPKNLLKTSVLLGFGADLDLKLFRGTVGANASFGTILPETPTVKTLEFVLNENGDRPYIKRVRGAMKGDLTVTLDAWIVRIKKSWEWASIPIDQSFNTEEQFFLVPADVSEGSLSLATSVPVDFESGIGPHLVSSYFPLARYSGGTASSGTQGIAFLDPEIGGTGMKLKVALHSGPWSAPVEVTSAPAIVGNAVLPMPGGGWMVVWSEMAAGDIDKLSPPTTLKFSTSATGATWTAPATIGTTAGTAFDLFLMPMPGTDIGLVYVESERGPQSTTVDVEAFLFSSGAWGSQQVLFDDLFLTGWDAAGPGHGGTEPAQFIGYTDVGGLVAVGWTGSGTTAPVSLDGSLEDDLIRVVSGPDDFFLAAHPLPGGGIGLFSKTGPGVWTPLPPVLPGVDPLELALAPVDDGAATHYFLTWTQPGAPGIGFAYLDPSGALLAGPTQLDPDSPGAYSRLQAQPIPGAHAADVFAMFENGDKTELRVFSTTEAGGVVATDLDSDTLDDHAELRIVDADTGDAIDTISDVLGGDDFDSDGFTNAAELAAGTDPTDPDSFPGQIVEIFAAVPEALELDEAPGFVEIRRTGNTSVPVTVLYSTAGTATSGTDYTALTGSVLLETGIEQVFLDIAPVCDDLAEGDETVDVTLTADPAYAVGTASSATVTIEDKPIDAWRFANFTPSELADPLISGFGADTEDDGWNVFLEYAFDGDPDEANIDDQPILTAMVNMTTGKKHLTLVFLRRKDDLELAYLPQISTDLQTWTNADDDDIEVVSIIDNGDGTETVTIRDREAIEDNSRRIMRVMVTRLSGP